MQMPPYAGKLGVDPGGRLMLQCNHRPRAGTGELRPPEGWSPVWFGSGYA